jgi:transposase InsO family protein
MSSASQRNRLLNNLIEFKTKDGIDKIIEYVKTGIIPTGLTARQRRQWLEHYDNKNWKVINNTLFYEPSDLIKLEVLPPDDKIINEKLKDLYDDIREGFANGQSSFYNCVASKYLNIKRNQSNEFLRHQESYQLTRPIRRVVNRPIVNKTPNELWQIDCINVSSYGVSNFNGQSNSRYKFIFTCVDSFSKRVWARALKSESAKDILQALKSIIEESKTKPHLLQSDNGSAFIGIPFNDFLKQEDIKHLYSRSHTPTDNANVERMNRTIRDKMKQVMVKMNSLEWVKWLPDIVENINGKKTRQGYSPNTLWTAGYSRVDKNLPLTTKPKDDADNLEDIQTNVRNKAIIRAQDQVKAKKEKTMEVGDWVRIDLNSIQGQYRKVVKGQMEKKLLAIHWSVKVYRIKSVIRNRKLRRNSYLVETDDGNVLMIPPLNSGAPRQPLYLFGNQLQLVPHPDKIVKTQLADEDAGKKINLIQPWRRVNHNADPLDTL